MSRPTKFAQLQDQAQTQSALIQQMALHIGIYQSVVGDLPGDVVMDVAKNLNPTLVPKTMGDFISHVREVAAKLAEKARQPVQSTEEGSHSPYNAQTDEPATQPSALDIVGNALAGTAPRTPLWVPPTRK